ncbi:hypothetical protein HW555_004394 [Spodoptera exigua]|uniref:BEN domain-containing protein n=1 Tax=Spodoptera exigua TaxID=7107 RepID=A0A835GLM5_SPOEX|nr:hypothetical protein HW555_004394 [Spodoptera exigua]
MWWVLVQWKNGKCDVVHVRSVVRAPTNEVRPADMITLNWAGRQRLAVVVALANKGERQTLETMMTMSNKKSPVAGPSRLVVEEDHEDYSPSASSWKPSDDDTESAESDEEVQPIKKLKAIEPKRQYFNRKSTKKPVTPTHRPIPVVPRSAQPASRRKTLDKSYDDRSNNRRRSLPNFTRNFKAERNNNQSKAMKKGFSFHVDNMKMSFRCLLDYIAEHENSLRSESPRSRELEQQAQQLLESLDSLESSLLSSESSKVNNTNDSQPGPSRPMEDVEPMEEDEDQMTDNEFDRSDDEVLITNKFNRVLAKEINKMKLEQNISAKAIERSIKNITNKINTGELFGKVRIGTGQTMVHKDKYNKVNWKSYTVATRSLLLATFSRRILATHSLTGKKSPAFQNKPAKMCLDPKIVTDVVYEITEKFGVPESLVRTIITTKCADEAKMLKMRQNKMKAGENNENIPPPPPPADAEEDE